MARPRTCKHPNGGEIIMRNMSQEDADKVKAFVMGEDLNPIVAERLAAQPAAVAEGGDVAITKYHTESDNKWHVVVYNIDRHTKVASESEHSICDSGPEASRRFKILSVKHKFAV